MGQRAPLLVGAVAVVGGLLWMAVPVTVDRGSGYGQLGRFMPCDGDGRFLVAAECSVRESERDGVGRLAILLGAVAALGGLYLFGASSVEASEGGPSVPPDAL